MSIVLAKSKAGHDKGHIYLIYKEEDEILWLVNGVTKTVAKPKKKKKMHVQLIKKLPEEIAAYQEKEVLDDAAVREILGLYTSDV